MQKHTARTDAANPQHHILALGKPRWRSGTSVTAQKLIAYRESIWAVKNAVMDRIQLEIIRVVPTEVQADAVRILHAGIASDPFLYHWFQNFSFDEWRLAFWLEFNSRYIDQQDPGNLFMSREDMGIPVGKPLTGAQLALIRFLYTKNPRAVIRIGLFTPEEIRTLGVRAKIRVN